MNKNIIFVHYFLKSKLETVVPTVTYILVILYFVLLELVQNSKNICFFGENCNNILKKNENSSGTACTLCTCLIDIVYFRPANL